MALLGSHSHFNKNPVRFISGATYSSSKGNFYKNGSLRNGDSVFLKYSARPNGYGVGYAIMLARSPGGLASYTKSYSESLLSFNMAGGRNLEATEAGALTTNNPILDRIISLLASSGGVLNASAAMDAALLLQATSSGAVSTDVLLGAIFSVTATAQGQASYNAFLTALASISAEAGGPNPLSPEGLSEAVWSSVLNDYTTPGTLGYAIYNMNIELPKKLDKGMFIALK